jgi:hypothetical protein
MGDGDSHVEHEDDDEDDEDVSWRPLDDTLLIVLLIIKE